MLTMLTFFPFSLMQSFLERHFRAGDSLFLGVQKTSISFKQMLGSNSLNFLSVLSVSPWLYPQFPKCMLFANELGKTLIAFPIVIRNDKLMISDSIEN